MVPGAHFVSGRLMGGPYPDQAACVTFGLGCFWGAERCFWETPGVFVTAVGYSGGTTPNPTYEEVCSGRTGHTEVVLVFFDPAEVSFDRLLQAPILKNGDIAGTVVEITADRCTYWHAIPGTRADLLPGGDDTRVVRFVGEGRAFAPSGDLPPCCRVE